MAAGSKAKRGLRRVRRVGLMVAMLAALAFAVSRFSRSEAPVAQIGGEEEAVAAMVHLPKSRFEMGSEHGRSRDQRPAHMVELGEFWMDRREVTNRQFAAFVRATDYLTTAEQIGRSSVFLVDEKKWAVVEGANWRHPGGPQTSLAGRDDYPVVQVSWYDAAAFAHWAEKQLPTEAQWEYAARAGLYDAAYPWGRSETPGEQYQANYWQGWFPDQDRGVDGFRDLAPVGSFPPNGYGLDDLAGNVWEWCADWYAPDAYETAVTVDPKGPSDGTERVRRGGSWLCAENYSDGIQVFARSSAPPGAATNHVGFRCVRNEAPE